MSLENELRELLATLHLPSRAFAVIERAITELERQPIRWRPIAEAPSSPTGFWPVLVWVGNGDGGRPHIAYRREGWVNRDGYTLPGPTHFAEIVGPEGGQ